MLKRDPQAAAGATTHGTTDETAELVGELIAAPTALFRLLSDPIRLRMLFYLLELGECNVAGLCRKLRRSQPAISYHLALLREVGLVDHRREGQSSFYYVECEQAKRMLGPFVATLMHGRRRVRWDAYVVEHQPQPAASASRLGAVLPAASSPAASSLSSPT